MIWEDKSVDNKINCLSGTWSVVTTVRAPSFMLNKFIEHYLKLECDYIHIFFDDPQCVEVDDTYYSHPKVRLQVCTDAYWNSQLGFYPQFLERKPSGVESRQYANYLNIQRSTSSEWLLNVDVDELLCTRISISEYLSIVPDNIFLIAMKPFEAVYDYLPTSQTVWDTNFFKTLDGDFKDYVSQIFSKTLKPNRYGFWGHHKGKAFFRSKHLLRYLSCHFPRPLNRRLVERFFTSKIDLLHFEAMTPELFKEKRLRRINKTTYARQISNLNKERLDVISEKLSEGDSGYIDNLYKDMNVLSSDVLTSALNEGFIVEKVPASGEAQSLGYLKVETHHCTYLAMDCETGIVIHETEDKIISSPSLTHVFVEVEAEPKGQCFFYALHLDRIFYFFVNEKGVLVGVSSEREGQILSFSKLPSSSRFSLCFNDVYLTARLSEALVFKAVAPKDWEIFKVVDA